MPSSETNPGARLPSDVNRRTERNHRTAPVPVSPASFGTPLQFKELYYFIR